MYAAGYSHVGPAVPERNLDARFREKEGNETEASKISAGKDDEESHHVTANISRHKSTMGMEIRNTRTVRCRRQG